MTAASLLAELRRRGIDVDLVGDRVRLRPASRLTSAELEVARQHRDELAAMLRAAATPATPTSPDPATCAEPVACAECHQVQPIMLVLAPAADGSVIAVCSSCYRGTGIADWPSTRDRIRANGDRLEAARQAERTAAGLSTCPACGEPIRGQAERCGRCRARSRR